jgi:hypothetical protein
VRIVITTEDFKAEWIAGQDITLEGFPGTSGVFRCVETFCISESRTENGHWEYSLEEVPAPKTLTLQRVAWLENWANNTIENRDVADTVLSLLAERLK